jgi:hypothetical protein
MEKTNFEKLDIYRLAEQVADQMWNIVLRWPGLAQKTVGEQVIRSADSIGANIAEGSGRGTATDNRRFCEWPEDHSTKRDTGYDELTIENSWFRTRRTHCPF